MNRYLDFFEPGAGGAIEKSLERAFEAGGRKALVVGAEACGQELANTLTKTGFSWVEGQWATFGKMDIADADVVLVTGANSADVSRALHACIESNVAVIAPVTEHHYSRRTVFLLSIPKAGTHMVIRLLDLMGLGRSPEESPQPGTWCTPIGYHYHAPCRDLMNGDWFDPMGRQLLFRSPAVFVYRNPMDIVVSELDWFVRPEHTFSGYLNRCADKSEQLDRLIADSTVMGTIRDRINGFAGWMNFDNVIPISYEELVGKRGGGSDDEQGDTIWALQLKLHVPGSPSEYGSCLYDSASATFSKGRIGRHVECFEERHFALFQSLSQDFMQTLGYARGSQISSKAQALRRRPLVVKQLSEDCLYKPRLVRESVWGCNIVEIAGKYFPVRQGVHVMSAEEAKAVSASQDGFMVWRDAVDAVIHGGAGAGLTPALPEAAAAELAMEGYLGFNIVRHNGGWSGFDQALGAMDVDSLGKSAFEDFKRNGTCVTGESVADVKAEILRLVMRQMEQRDRTLDEELRRLKQREEQRDRTLDEELRRLKQQEEQRDRTLSEELRRLKQQEEQRDRTLSEELRRLKQQEEQHDHTLDEELRRLKQQEEQRDHTLDEELRRLKQQEEQHDRTLRCIEEQEARVSCNPLVKIGFLMGRLFKRKK